MKQELEPRPSRWQAMHDYGRPFRNPWFILLFLSGFVMMAWLSLARYHAFTTWAFDLGAMSQAIWRTTQGDPLIFTVEGIAFSRLARHVELFYFLLAPLYALRPSPTTLLIFQAGLYALGGLPVYALAQRRLHSRWVATAVSAIYLFYPVAQTAVLFAFHGDTLAMPLLLFAIDALDRKAGIGYWLWLLLALSCKFYVAVPVAALGVILWLQGRRRIGLITTLVAIAWFGLAFGVIRPFFAPPEAVQVEATAASYIGYYFRQMNLSVTGLTRLSNAVIVFVPALLLAWRAPYWLLPAAAVAVPVLISSGPGPSYDYRFHHYALAVPFLLAAAIYGAANHRAIEVQAKGWQARVLLSLIFTLIMTVFLVNTPLNPRFYNPPSGSGMGLDPLSGVAVSARDRMKADWLAPLAAGNKPIAADRLLALPLVNREILYLVPPENNPLEQLLPQVDYVAVDALFDFALENAGHIEWGVRSDYETIGALLQNPAWGVVDMRDGLLLFSDKGAMLAQAVELAEMAGERPFLAQFDDKIGLVDVIIEPLGDNRYLLQCDWVALRPLSETPPLIAVSRPDGLAQTRIAHLPTLGLLPTTEWPVGQIVRETFEFTLPEDTLPGQYPLYVGWYETGSLFAAETDQRSRVGDETLLGWITVP